jgi:hypothetical protein
MGTGESASGLGSELRSSGQLEGDVMGVSRDGSPLDERIALYWQQLTVALRKIAAALTAVFSRHQDIVDSAGN